MVVWDASFLVLLVEPRAKPPDDTDTGKPVTHCVERIGQLVIDLDKQRIRICIPAPSLAEFLVKAGSARSEYLQAFREAAAFKIEPFGERAAIECALLMDGALSRRKALTDVETRAKVKFDRQIIAIAKAANATAIYTEDKQLAKVADQNGIPAFTVQQLPIPAEAAQGKLPFKEPGSS